MITTKLYLDCRGVKDGSAAPLRLVITLNSLRAFLPLSTSLLPSQWDAKAQSVTARHPRASSLNAFIQQQKVLVDSIILRLESEGRLNGLRANQIKDLVKAQLHPASQPKTGLSLAFDEFIERKSGRTSALYVATKRRIIAFLGDEGKWAGLRFEDVNRRWLDRFVEFLAMSAPSANARNIHLRNLRAVFNYAIDCEYTSCYPFRGFKIRPTPTRKRALSVSQLRKVLLSEVPEHLCMVRDMWALSFMLRGINVADLCALSSVDADGCVRYTRAKTHKPYEVKVEPEAAAIIARYGGHRQLLFMLDHYKGYRIFYTRFARGLHALRDYLNSVDDGVHVDELTSYWARHSWATVAALLDVPKETIAAALGHGGNSVTDIYIDFDVRKVHAANRRVLDYVLYDKGAPVI